MRALVDYYADDARSTRRAVAWSAVGVGAAGMGFGSVVVALDTKNLTGYGVILVGFAIAAGGGLSFLLSSEYESFRDTVRATDDVNLEAEVARWAKRERDSRTFRVALGYGAAGVSAIVGGWFVLDRSRGFETSGAFLLGLAAVDVVVASWLLGTDGPIETAVHAYERSTGRVLKASSTPSAHLQLAPMPGGAFAGIGGAF
jgi:hypothetical protein